MVLKKYASFGNLAPVLGLAVCIPPRYVAGEPANRENILYMLSPAPPEADRDAKAKRAYATAPTPADYTITYYLAFCSAAEEWEGSFHNADEWFTWVKQWKKEILNN